MRQLPNTFRVRFLAIRPELVTQAIGFSLKIGKLNSGRGSQCSNGTVRSINVVAAFSVHDRAYPLRPIGNKRKAHRRPPLFPDSRMCAQLYCVEE